MKKQKRFSALTKNVLTSLCAAFLLCAGASTEVAHAQSEPERDEVETVDQSRASAELARNLSSRDPLVRQHAAEGLARLAATEQQRLVAGYRLQERDARVRLALDWALYRMGKTEALFEIVRALEGSRSNQATTYLNGLEGPEPLYVFLKTSDGERLARLLETLARLGDEQTLERIRPYSSSLDSRVAQAARFATRELTLRLSERPELPTRPRHAGNSVETEQTPETSGTPETSP